MFFFWKKKNDDDDVPMIDWKLLLKNPLIFPAREKFK